MALSDTLSDAFGTVVNAGANLIKDKAAEAGRTNNAPVPSDTASWAKWQPMTIAAVAGLAVILVVILAKRR